MLKIPNRLATKQNLISQIERLKDRGSTLSDAPVTDLDIQPETAQFIETLTQELENLSPFPRPLSCGSNLLDGAWLLQYSTAREIRSLKKLPWGFLVGKIYQIIDLNNASFENKALVEHSSGLLSGYVRVTATFEPSNEQDDRFRDRTLDSCFNGLQTRNALSRKINIDFKKRFLAIERVFGINTSLLDPFKVVEAKNPIGRIPSLNITYIDETMRIGRGGDGSLFILTRV